MSTEASQLRVLLRRQGAGAGDRAAEASGGFPHITRQFLVVGLSVDLLFAVLTGAAFVRLWGLAGASAHLVLTVAALSHLVKDAIMAAIIVAVLRPVERWRAAPERTELLGAAGEAGYRAPPLIGAAWGVVWTAVYPAAALTLQHWLPPGTPLRHEAMVATTLLAFGVSGAGLSLSYAISGALMASTAGELSLLARTRGVPLRGGPLSLSLRARLAILMLCLAVGPSLWMASIAYMQNAHAALTHEPASNLTLLLFVFVSSSAGPLCAFFLTGALARPLRNIGAVISQIVQEGDTVKGDIRVPVYYQDEIGRLAEAVNDMTDRLRESSSRIDRQVAELDGAYRAAKDAIHARDEFLSVASHELRTPLTALWLTVQNLERRARNQKRADTPDDLAARYTLAGRQIQYFQRLVDGLLDVSRLVEGRLRIEPEPLDLAELVRESTSRWTEEAERAHCRLVVLVEEHVHGSWDRMRLEQVMNNLVSNALKFGGGQPVEIELTCDDRLARVRVTDHGIGVALEDQERIFQRFERAVSARNYGGLGLGLWITRQILDSMGGRIHVASVPGAGSSFLIELPRGDRTTP